jgi:hypothetical protein
MRAQEETMKRVLIAVVLAVWFIAVLRAVRAQPPAYQGSRFSEVWALVKSDPYAVLPEDRVTLASFFEWTENRLLDASIRTLNDRDDVLPPFRKLVHPIGVCMAGTWSISEDSKYTGYFAKGTTGLIIARASTALGETRRGEPRTFGFAGKLYPTDNPNHEPLLPTANFFAIENLAGTYTPHFLDAAQTNDILYIEPRPGALFRGPLGVVALQSFATADETLDLTQPLVRQLYPIAEMGISDPVHAVAPRWIRIVGSQTTPRIDELDYRDELDIKHYPDGIHFDILVADKGTRIGPKEWHYLGEIHIQDTVASDSCDHRLHFSHPHFRSDQP